MSNEIRVREGDSFVHSFRLDAGAGASITPTTTASATFAQDDDSVHTVPGFSPISVATTPGSDEVSIDVTSAAAPALSGVDARYRMMVTLTDGTRVESFPTGGERFRFFLVVEAVIV